MLVRVVTVRRYEINLATKRHKNHEEELSMTLTAHASGPSFGPGTLWFHGFAFDIRLCLHWFRFGVVRLFFLRRRAGFLERSGYQVVTRSRGVDEGKHVIVRGALSYDFDFSLVLQPRELTHHKVLLGYAHVPVVDVECEAG